MTWTYAGTLTTSLDKVRLKIGDTDTNDQQFIDETISALLTSEGSVAGAAIACCKALIAKYARKVNSSVGKLSKQASDLTAHYQELLMQLQGELIAGSSVGMTFIDSDREPAFTRDMMENDSLSPNNDEP